MIIDDAGLVSSLKKGLIAEGFIIVRGIDSQVVKDIIEELPRDLQI